MTKLESKQQKKGFTQFYLWSFLFIFFNIIDMSYTLFGYLASPDFVEYNPLLSFMFFYGWQFALMLKIGFVALALYFARRDLVINNRLFPIKMATAAYGSITIFYTWRMFL